MSGEVRTGEQKRQFERDWDRGYEEWCSRELKKDPAWTPPVLETVRPGSPSYFGRKSR